MALPFDGNVASKSPPYHVCVLPGCFAGMEIKPVFLILGDILWYCDRM